ncbi:hypothetical protein ACSEV5_21005 [Pseudomonas aeruginosa]
MTTLELLDEAIAHQNAARDLLRLLSGAENLGTPAPEILSGALSGIEYLLGVGETANDCGMNSS